MDKENSIISAAADLLDKISLISNFPSKMAKLKNKLNPYRLKFLILQSSRESQDDYKNSPTSSYDR